MTDEETTDGETKSVRGRQGFWESKGVREIKGVRSSLALAATSLPYLAIALFYKEAFKKRMFCF